MLPWLEEKYVNLLAPSLRNFKKKKDSLWNLSCPLCGDSDSNKKLRGYIYRKKGTLKFHCHNCTTNIRFETLLKQVNANLYFEYRKECMVETRRQSPRDIKYEEPKQEPIFNLFDGLKSIADLPVTHPARKYVQDRLIPGIHYLRIFYAPYFKRFVNSVVPDKFSKESLTRDEPRLIIPFINKDASISGFTGRSFDPDATLRYMMISLNDDPKLFGIDRVDMKKPYYIVEGPIDAMFLPNTIAAGGSNIRNVMGPNGIGVFDNQPRNPEICKLIEMAIEEGMKVVIWPSGMEGKDINELIKSGLSQQEVVGIISENTYIGLTARLKFNEWKRI